MLIEVRSTRIDNPAPLDYSTPPFPSLYWPLHAKPGVPNYLYYAHDIWRYTLLWTLIVYGITHIAVAAWAVAMQLGKGKNAWQYAWIIPLVYALIAGIEALLAGSLVGLMWVVSRNSRRSFLFLSFLLILLLLDSVPFTMQDIFRCQHGFRSYGH